MFYLLIWFQMSVEFEKFTPFSQKCRDKLAILQTISLHRALSRSMNPKNACKDNRNVNNWGSQHTRTQNDHHKRTHPTFPSTLPSKELMIMCGQSQKTGKAHTYTHTHAVQGHSKEADTVGVAWIQRAWLRFFLLMENYYYCSRWVKLLHMKHTRTHTLSLCFCGFLWLLYVRVCVCL